MRNPKRFVVGKQDPKDHARYTDIGEYGAKSEAIYHAEKNAPAIVFDRENGIIHRTESERKP